MKDSVWPDAGKEVSEAEDSLSEGNPEKGDVPGNVSEEGAIPDDGLSDVRVSDAVMFAGVVSGAGEPVSALSARVLSAGSQPVSIRMIMRNIVVYFSFIGISFHIDE